ncbi:MAG: high-affinity nickel-transporter [Pyrinomonadaceae bacterium]
MPIFRIILIAFAIAGFVGSAAAHPLGNFSVNQYSRLEVGKSEIKIRQVLDLAEIPTFQESAVIDEDRDGAISQIELDAYAARLTPIYLSKLSLIVNGERLALRDLGTTSTLALGAADLKTLHIVWDLGADLSSVDEENKVTFTNVNYAERVGWREVVVNRAGGVAVYNSTAFGSNASDELRTFPAEVISSPLNEREVEFTFASGSRPDGVRALQNRDGHLTAQVQNDRLAALIAVPAITPAIAIFGLLLAFGLGAMHAMSPGHGKTVVGAYLVGSKGTAKQAAFLGATVTITHTLGVFALGLLTLFASTYILPETIMPFLSFFSGLIVLYIGLTMFKSRLFSALGISGRDAHHHDHGDDGHSHRHVEEGSAHSHTHDGHTHSHLPPDEISWKSLLALGVSGGLLPCPSALVLMLSAINLNRVGYGLILTVAFSLGLAATLTVVGLIFVYGGHLFTGTRLGDSRILKALPVMSALVIATLGAVICYQSFS